MKIQILGFSGSGKSTLAKKLAEIYSIPVLHLDTVKYRSDRSERPNEERIEIVKKFLAENENWIIDGNYKSVCPERYEITDMTILLHINRFVCYWSAKKRAKRRKYQQDTDFPCEDKFDKEFKNWLLWKGRTRERKKLFYDILNRTKGEKVILKSRRQINKFLERLTKKVNNSKDNN